MTVADRFRGAPARRVGRFLPEHVGCGGGFDVDQEDRPGSGRLEITCRGCGTSVQLRASGEGGAQIERIVPGPAVAAGSAAVAGAAVSPAAAGSETPEAASSERRPVLAAAAPGRTRRRLWDGILAAVLVVAGLAMITVGLLDSSDENRSEPSNDSAVVETTEATGQSSATTGASATGAGATGAATPPAPAAPANPLAANQRRLVLGAFSISLPEGWRQRRSDGGVSFTPPRGHAKVQVYLQDGVVALDRLIAPVAALLSAAIRGPRSEPPGPFVSGAARPSRSRRFTPGGRSAPYCSLAPARHSS